MPALADSPNPQLVRDVIILGGAVLLSFSLGAWLMHRLRVRRDQALARARNLRGRVGEARAATLLREAGYEIIARQQRAFYALRAGDSDRRVGLSFDFVVSRDGKQCVAEVKTGALVTQLKHADTRRQLLEYQLASGGAQVLLVDPERERITEIAFPLQHAMLTTAEPPDAGAEPEQSTRAQTSESSRSDWPLLVCLIFACALGVYLFAR